MAAPRTPHATSLIQDVTIANRLPNETFSDFVVFAVTIVVIQIYEHMPQVIAKSRRIAANRILSLKFGAPSHFFGFDRTIACLYFFYR